MFDESSTLFSQFEDSSTLFNQIEDWPESMGFYLSPNDLTSISRNEKTQALHSVLSSRVRPKEIVKEAKLHLLYSKLIKLGNNDNRSNQSDKELELLKTRIILKGKLKQKEQQDAEKKEMCMELIKEDKELIQKIQWMNSVLNDENKKLLFLKLNSKALDNTFETYCSLRQAIKEVLEVQQRKRGEESSISLDAQVLEAMRECHEHVLCSKRKMKEQLKIVDLTSSEYVYDGPNAAAMNWKTEILEYVTRKLENYPRNQVFAALLVILNQQIVSVQSLLENSAGMSLPDSMRYSESLDNAQGQDKLQRIFIKNCFAEVPDTPAEEAGDALQEQIKNISHMSTPDLQLVENSPLVEKLRMVEIQLQDLDKCIQERIKDCKNLKARMTVNLKEMERIMYFIKHFSIKPKPVEKDTCPTPHLDKLCGLMHQLCTAGSKEIQLFARMPLVAIEKLTLANEKIPVHELTSSYLKVIPSTKDEYSSLHPPMLQNATSLESHDLLIHVWKQLTDLSLLFKTHSLIEPFAGSPEQINFEPYSLDEESKKMKLTYYEFLSLFSTYDIKVDEVSKLLDALQENPLTSVIPNDILTCGMTIEEFTKLHKKVNNDESCMFQISVGDASDDFFGNA